MGPPDLKKMLQVKIKPRKDSYSDQFSRILMVKMMMLTAAVTGISWAKDKFTCIVPKNHDVTAGFVAKACWINGVYIYRELDPKHQSFYYGIPSDISMDGMNKYGEMCNSDTQNCEEMEKTFFLQYQWFPLGVAALGFIYYLPYILFCVVNTDIISIKDMIKKKGKEEVNYDELLTKYFSRKNNSISNLNARILLNVVVKLLYVVANIVGMIIIDSALNGQFMSFGTQYSSWLNLSPTQRHDYTIEKDPKAGNELLPGFGLCQVTSSGQDIKNTIINKHVFVCELSQHVLYQYILIILWYMLVCGIAISIFGLIKHIFNQISAVFCVGLQGEDVERVYAHLTTREQQYMDFIRRKNMPVFGEVLHRLMEAKGMKRRSNSDSSSGYEKAREEKERMMAE